MQTIVGTFLALLMLFGITQILVSGQEDIQSDLREEQTERRNNTIQGVWQTTTTRLNCQTGASPGSFRGLVTFNEGGTVNETSAVLSPTLRGPGHGVWEQTSRRRYTAFYVFLRFNADGTFGGTQKITQHFELRPSGNAFDATSTSQFFDANDNLVGTACGTLTGTRFEQ